MDAPLNNAAAPVLQPVADNLPARPTPTSAIAENDVLDDANRVGAIVELRHYDRGNYQGTVTTAEHAQAIVREDCIRARTYPSPDSLVGAPPWFVAWMHHFHRQFDTIYQGLDTMKKQLRARGKALDAVNRQLDIFHYRLNTLNQRFDTFGQGLDVLSQRLEGLERRRREQHEETVHHLTDIDNNMRVERSGRIIEASGDDDRLLARQLARYTRITRQNGPGIPGYHSQTAHVPVVAVGDEIPFPPTLNDLNHMTKDEIKQLAVLMSKDFGIRARDKSRCGAAYFGTL